VPLDARCGSPQPRGRLVEQLGRCLGRHRL
jgi:hypothetical protein